MVLASLVTILGFRFSFFLGFQKYSSFIISCWQTLLRVAGVVLYNQITSSYYCLSTKKRSQVPGKLDQGVQFYRLLNKVCLVVLFVRG